MWENAGCVSGDSAAASGEAHAQKVGGAADNKADEGRDRGRGRKEKAVNMTSLVAAALGATLRRVSYIPEVLVWRCHARLPNILAFFLFFFFFDHC